MVISAALEKSLYELRNHTYAELIHVRNNTLEHLPDHIASVSLIRAMDLTETMAVAREANDIARSASFAASAAAVSASEANTIARLNSRRAWRAEIITAIATIAAIVAAIAAVKGIK